jgi:hypothetical protein
MEMESILVSKRPQKNRMGILTPTPNYKEAPYMYRKILSLPWRCTEKEKMKSVYKS